VQSAKQNVEILLIDEGRQIDSSEEHSQNAWSPRILMQEGLGNGLN
jgi:hypothetical protein